MSLCQMIEFVYGLKLRSYNNQIYSNNLNSVNIEHHSIQSNHCIDAPKNAEETIVQGISKPDSSNVTSEKKIKKPAPKVKEIDVSQLDLRVGHIKQVELHPDADKLFVSQIDINEEKLRTVCSGLVGHVQPEELIDRKVLLLCNLKPVKMRGITSEAMVMCAINDDQVEVVEVSSNAVAGEKVKCPKYDLGEPDKRIDGKGKTYQTIQADLKTNENGFVCYKDIPLQTAVSCEKIHSKSFNNSIVR